MHRRGGFFIPSSIAGNKFPALFTDSLVIPQKAVSMFLLGGTWMFVLHPLLQVSAKTSKSPVYSIMPKLVIVSRSASAMIQLCR